MFVPCRRICSTPLAVVAIVLLSTRELTLAQAPQTRTAFEFSRAYDTCDSDDRAFEGTTRVVYAWNDVEPASPTSAQYHGPTQRGTESVNLVGSNPVFPVPETDLVLADLTVKEHTINGANAANTFSTLYWCELYKIPDDQPYHVVRFDMSIKPENLLNVHHAVLYECPAAEGYEGLAGTCPSSANPALNITDPFTDEVAACEGGNVVWGWAIGGGNSTLPENIGYPVGMNGVTYVMLEMHYDIPDYSEVTDNSGMVLHLTPSLREIEAGTLAAGALVDPSFIRIPPGERAFEVTGTCPGVCLEDSIRNTTDQKITLFSGWLHAHLAGRAITASHVRNGTELEPILVDDYYDFNYQQFMWFFDNQRDVLPGDDILVKCTYNTEDRTEDTVGGIQTVEEMCLAYFMYYPRLPGSLCWGGPAVVGEIAGLNALRCNDDTIVPSPQQPNAFETVEITTPFVEPDNCPINNVPQAALNADPELLTDVTPAELDAWRASFDNSLTLRDGSYEMYWTAFPNNNTVRFGVDVATEGWLGFGFSPNGGMPGSDMLMAWITESGELHFSDRHATSQSIPAIDAEQSYFGVRGLRYEVGGGSGSTSAPPDTTADSTTTAPPDTTADSTTAPPDTTADRTTAVSTTAGGPDSTAPPSGLEGNAAARTRHTDVLSVLVLLCVSLSLVYNHNL